MAIELYLNFENISFIFLTISLLIIGILYAFHYKYSKQLIFSFLGQRYANYYLRDDNVFKQRVNILFFILMVLNISVFIWSVEHFNSFFDFIIVVVYVSLYYVLKYIALKILGFLFNVNQIAIIAIFFTTLFDKIFALFSFPFLFILHFFIINLEQYSINIILGGFTIFFLLKVFWMLRIGIRSFGLSAFYLFLYICILEFFPLVLVFRGIFIL